MATQSTSRCSVRGILLKTGQQVLPHRHSAFDLWRQARRPGIAHHPFEVLPLDVEGRSAPAVGEPDLASTGDVVADLPDRPDRVLEGEIPEDHFVLEHLEQRDRRPDLDVVSYSDMFESPAITCSLRIPLGVGMGLVASVDDRAARVVAEETALPDVLGALGEREHGAAAVWSSFPAPAQICRVTKNGMSVSMIAGSRSAGSIR